jgi:hypothetical protein
LVDVVQVTALAEIMWEVGLEAVALMEEKEKEEGCGS